MDTAGHGIDGLWAEYKKTGNRALRDQLIVHYAPVVKYVAGRVSVGLPRHVDEADLASYGIIGLIDAIERFEPLRNIKFETYAIPRIKGAIIDELRSIDWVPRSVRAKARAVEQSYSKLEATLHRTPTDAEVAADLEMTDAEFQTALRKISFVGVVALDEVFRGGDRSDRSTLGETLPDSTAGPMDTFEVKETKEALIQAVSQMADREKTVLTLYYYEGLTLAEIGDILGVTESRVCQIHTKAVLQLRAKLADRPEAAGRRPAAAKAKATSATGGSKASGGASGRSKASDDTKAPSGATGAKNPSGGAGAKAPSGATGAKAPSGATGAKAPKRVSTSATG